MVLFSLQNIHQQQPGALSYRQINFAQLSLCVCVSVQQYILPKHSGLPGGECVYVCEWSPAQWSEKATTNPLKDNACVSVYIIIYICVCVCACVRLVLARVEQHFQ